ncbi:MAG: hypothetical protein N4A72_01560 [Bacteroidales bacterium]|jgi:ABC-type maltose transport system permease subunit|nr:hypothetical protein [Bacteroidales bacterium]
MNNELKQVLDKKTDDKLFYLFKHDGVMDFKRKLAAGVILNQRGYNKQKLRHERDKIIADLNNRIDTFSKPMQRAEKYRRNIRNNIIIAAAIAIIYITTIILWRYFYAKEPIINNSTIIVLLLFIAMLMYRILNRSRSLRKLMKSDIKDLKIYRSRIAAINKNWRF